ncbi:MAG: protein kinase [Vicinamibacterales bacterium]|nr:protein kinase [Vicinamibacterales bacterium]
MTALPGLRLTRAFAGVSLVALLSVLALGLHAGLVRPFLWPGGIGLTLSGDTMTGGLAAPGRLRVARPPALDEAAGPLVVLEITTDGSAAGAGLAAGDAVLRIADGRGRVFDAGATLPDEAAAQLRLWREGYWLDRARPLTMTVAPAAGGPPREVTLAPVPAWALPADARRAWLAEHAGPLAQMAAFTLGAIVLIALGTSGATARLMTLALLFTAIGNGGSLAGTEGALPGVLRDLLVIFGWLVTPLAFPVIGLAVLYFPHRAPLLDRAPWIVPAIAALALPMLMVGGVSALVLLGVDAALGPLAWLAARGWIYDASFALALAANVAIVAEGIQRYRHSLDHTERRRIEIVVFTGVPAVFAYALKEGLPLVAGLAGVPLSLPLPLAALLQAIVLLPAFGLPYAVAVRHVFSPRTVLRRGLQYALARRTLSAVIVLPVAALVWSLIVNRDRPLADIILGQPLFYVITLALVGLGIRYRDAAQRWLDQRFFREAYDAREILLSLASRVPYETDPRELVSLVLTHVERALAPESLAVLAVIEGDTLVPVSSVHRETAPLPLGSGLVTLLQWSHEPLEVFLDDDRSPAARLPADDRQWLATTGTTLLVPIFAGGDGTPSLVGLIGLGQKRSEEPYTAEDRQLLSAIAAQMGVALNLTRLQRRATAPAAGTAITAAASTPTVRLAAPDTAGTVALSVLGSCPACLRCVDLSRLVCPDDGAGLVPVPSLPPIVDGKYRVDALVGRGGMGSVFRARDVRLDRDVAIKIVRADLLGSSEARARFRREAQIVARLQHPAIVAVFDYGTLPDGTAYLVMEFVRGEDFRGLLKRERRLEPGRLVPLLQAIAGGVQAAHDAGVLHRDLKPENVLLPASGAGPKVLDFGVAKVADGATDEVATFTAHATIVGTPAYMAPEQLRGGAIDVRADVYSLGVMTFEALTGTLPFGTGSLLDVGLQQASAAPSGADALPAALAPLVMRALALDPDGRPATPAAFADALFKAL